jgi:DNA integrity scanning protein DisA with diadenylate cyclase activity
MNSMSLHVLPSPAATPLPPLAHQGLRRMIEHFFPDGRLLVHGGSDTSPALGLRFFADRRMTFEWSGVRYGLTRERNFTVFDRILFETIVEIVSQRFSQDYADGPGELPPVRGWLEDRCVAAFVQADAGRADRTRAVPAIDALASAIEVLRRSAAATFENRRITTGVLVDVAPGATRSPGALRADSLQYGPSLTRFKTFSRLCDGLQTIALVDSAGALSAIVDIREYAASAPLPYPVPAAYAPHARATVGGRHVCLVLTAHGAIKVFAHGVQVFEFVNGRWKLSDIGDKFTTCEALVDNAKLAGRVLGAAAELADRRCGGLFVILDDNAREEALVSASDRLSASWSSEGTTRAKQSFHYLFRGANAVTMPAAVLETVARIDGAVVMSRNGELAAVGAILRGNGGIVGAEGARTTAALAASRHGIALKVSEDGVIALFVGGRLLWEL